jgi:hypothetical protein
VAELRRGYEARLTDEAMLGYLRRHAEVMLAQLDRKTFATSIPVPLQTWRLRGDPELRLALTGGEPVSAYAVDLRARHGGADGMLFTGYANDIPGYLPSDELLNRPASYAGGFDQDAPELASGSMAVYGHIAPFRGRPTPDSPDGVEQLVRSGLDAMLGGDRPEAR